MACLGDDGKQEEVSGLSISGLESGVANLVVASMLLHFTWILLVSYHDQQNGRDSQH